VRHSEFQRACREEFGEAYSAVLIREHWLTPFKCTAQDALERGIPAREVWLAMCEELQVPMERRHGRGLLDPEQQR